MLEKKILQELIDQALLTGADFAEIFLEDSMSSRMSVMSGDVTTTSAGNVHGAGVRLIQGVDEVYGFTNKITYESILDVVKNLRASFNGKIYKAKPLGDKKPYVYDVKRSMIDVSSKEKADKLQHLNKIISSHDKRIVQSVTQLLETKQNILVVNSNGVYQDDVRTYTRVVLMAVAEENGLMQQAFEGPGRYMGFEIFDELDFDQLAIEVATSAITLLHAKDIKSQVMPVVLHNGFGGVIFHEAVGHPLEATAVAKGLSPFVGKIGEKVGSDILTAYDDGNVKNAWGRLSFDDEGMPTQKNLLIEKGILKGFLIDQRNAKKMNMDPTGSARRQSYKYAPTSRMNSTGPLK
jgi:TldD protein